MRTLVLIALFAGPAMGDEALIACLENAPLEKTAFEQCNQDFQERCLAAGKDLVDFAPQTACYLGAVEKLAYMRSELANAPNSNVSDQLKAAALLRDAQMVDARCDYLTTTDLLRGGQGDESSKTNHSMCRAIGYASSYWLVGVHERLN